MAEVVWGWESFFRQLRSLLETCGREIDGASEEFSDFVLERLQLSVRSLTDIREILTSSPNVHFSATELQVVSEYVTTITQLLGILQSLSQQWEVHIDNLQSAIF